MNKLLFHIAFILIASNVYAQSIEVLCNTNKKEITIGEQFVYTIKVKILQPNTSVVMPILPDKFNGFEIIEKSKPQEIVENGNVVQTQTFTLAHFDSGAWAIPALDVKYSLPNEHTQNYLSDSILIKVKSPLVDLKQPIKDIIGPDKEGFTWKVLLFIWLGIIIFLAIVYLIAKLLIRKRKSKEAVWKRAINVLENEINNKTWLQNPKQFSSVVSNTLREYLHEHIGVYTLDKPTKELLQNVCQNEVTVPHIKVLEEIFINTDFVKFAKAELPVSQLEAIGNNALAFVQKTYMIILEKQNQLTKKN